MGQEYLIDTCVVIKYLNKNYTEEVLLKLDDLVDSKSNISFICKIELLVWNPSNESDMNIWEKFVKGSNVYSLTNDIIDLTISIRKETKIKIPDAIIAATSILYDYTLLTDNKTDFDKVISLG